MKTQIKIPWSVTFPSRYALEPAIWTCGGREKKPDNHSTFSRLHFTSASTSSIHASQPGFNLRRHNINRKKKVKLKGKNEGGIERVELELPNVSWGGIDCSVKGRIEPIGLQEVKESLWQWRHCSVFSFHPKLNSGSTSCFGGLC